MKNQTNKIACLLVICFALALSACKRSEEHPTENPATNAPGATNPPATP